MDQITRGTSPDSRGRTGSLVRRVRTANAVLRHSRRDAILISLAAVYATSLVVVPSAPLIAVGLWWTANTVAHNFIHLPFFRARAANATFSVVLSMLLGLPQTLWRDRHMAHHADRPWRMRWSAQMLVELFAVFLVWVWWASHGAQVFIGTWMLGWAGGLALCQLQGHFEHLRGTTSHYGKFYNLVFFNDGYHVEHHARPGTHWSELPSRKTEVTSRSSFPAVLRWIELAPLDALEKLVLRSSILQRMVLGMHARAFTRLLDEIPEVNKATIVGGGLFPRTALILRRLAPNADLTIIDRSPANVASARSLLDGEARFVESSFQSEDCSGADLLIIPLAFDGDRATLYENPPAPVVAIHDWIWNKHGDGVVVSILLLKRLNWVRGQRR